MELQRFNLPDGAVKARENVPKDKDEEADNACGTWSWQQVEN